MEHEIVTIIELADTEIPVAEHRGVLDPRAVTGGEQGSSPCGAGFRDASEEMLDVPPEPVGQLAVRSAAPEVRKGEVH